VADYLAGQRSLREIILPTGLPWLRVILAGSVSDESEHAFYQQLVAETNVLSDCSPRPASGATWWWSTRRPGWGP
jgi:chromosome partitioning protein